MPNFECIHIFQFEYIFFHCIHQPIEKYTRNEFDHYIHFLKLQVRFFIFLLLYVNDILITLKSKDEIEKFKLQLNQEFKMKYLGKS